MPSTDIKIEDVILQHTDKAISEANFSLLRKYLLDKSPLELVTQQIDGIITSHFTEKEQAFKKSTTQTAIDQQIQQDTNDQLLDDKAERRDRALKEEYSSSLPVKEIQLQNLTTQYMNKDTFYKQIRSQLAESESALRRITNRIHTIVAERHTLQAKIQAVLVNANPNVHTHTPTHEHTHTHAAPSQNHVSLDRPQNVHTHTPTHEHVTHTHPATPSLEQLALARLLSEENELSVQKQIIEEQISRKNAEQSAEYLIMQQILRESSQVDQDIKRMSNALAQELPSREQTRLLRQEKRTARHNARTNTEADIQLLLSSENYITLQEQLASKTRQFAAESSQLKDTVRGRSYPVYITQLELRLQQEKGLKIDSNDRQTLNMILNLMKNLQSMLNSELSKKSILTEKRYNLRRLETAWTQNQFELERCKQSNPELLKANTKLDEELIHLNQKLATTSGNITLSSVVSLISGVSGGVVTAIFFDTLIALPVTLGVVAIIGAIIAIAKYVEANGYREQIDLNTQTKTQNVATIKQQAQKIINIPQVILPDLELQITATKKEITQLETELMDLQKQINQINNHAERVGTAANEHGFFGGSSAAAGAPNVPPPTYDEAAGYTAPTFFVSAAPSSQASSYKAPEFPRMPDAVQPSAPPANGP